MAELVLARVTAPQASVVAGPIKTLDKKARSLLANDMPSHRFLGLLLERDYHADAIRFLAHALPKREAIWWGCLCAQQAAGNPAREQSPAGVKAAVQWVRDPSEKHRQAAQRPGQEDDMATPAGCLAMATFWSSGSMNAPGMPVNVPPPHLSHQVVAAAVLLAAVADDAPQTERNQRRFVAVGVDVANGKHLWETPR